MDGPRASRRLVLPTAAAGVMGAAGDGCGSRALGPRHAHDRLAVRQRLERHLRRRQARRHLERRGLVAGSRRLHEAGAVAPVDADHFRAERLAGGVFTGANLQMGNWIFGLESSFFGLGLSESAPARFFGHRHLHDRHRLADDGRGAHRLRVGSGLGVREGRLGRRQRYVVDGSPVWGSATTTSSSTAGPSAADRIRILAERHLRRRVRPHHPRSQPSPELPAVRRGIPIGTRPHFRRGHINSVMARASYLFRPEDLAARTRPRPDAHCRQ